MGSPGIEQNEILLALFSYFPTLLGIMSLIFKTKTRSQNTYNFGKLSCSKGKESRKESKLEKENTLLTLSHHKGGWNEKPQALKFHHFKFHSCSVYLTTDRHTILLITITPQSPNKKNSM